MRQAPKASILFILREKATKMSANSLKELHVHFDKEILVLFSKVQDADDKLFFSSFFSRNLVLKYDIQNANGTTLEKTYISESNNGEPCQTVFASLDYVHSLIFYLSIQPAEPQLFLTNHCSSFSCLVFISPFLPWLRI